MSSLMYASGIAESIEEEHQSSTQSQHNDTKKVPDASPVQAAPSQMEPSFSLPVSNGKNSPAKQVASDVADVVGSTDFRSKPKFYIGLNVVPSLMNQSIDNSAITNYDNSAYHFELIMTFDSKIKNPFNIPNSVRSYYAVHLMKYTNSGYTDSYWVEKATSIYAIYGQKYYLQSGHHGFGFGWYAGAGNYSFTDAYYWDTQGGPVYSYVDDSSFEVIAAAELFYQFDFKNFYAAPRIVLGLNQNNYELVTLFEFMLGVKFGN